MFHYAAFACESVAEIHRGVIARLCAALSDISVLHSMPNSEFGLLANRNHTGTKYTFWPCADESGLLININPKSGCMTKLAMRKVPGYVRLTPAEKDVALSALACIYGLSGGESCKVKFAITYDPTFKGSNLPINIALNNGLKIFNLADKNDIAKMISLIKALKGK